jgi:pyrimidine oxygenase
MGLWPGDEFYEFRYDYASEYVTIMKELWETGRSDFKGAFFTLDDCHLKPMPTGPIPIVSAGASARGRRFTAEYCDYNFTGSIGGPEGIAEVSSALREAADKTGRSAVPGTAGFMLNFDDFLAGIEVLGSAVMPLLA